VVFLIKERRGNMSLQRLFSLLIGAIGLLGIVGSRNLALFAQENVGTGFMPMLNSVVVLVFSVVLFITDKSKEKVDFHKLVVEGDPNKAFVFFLLNILLIILLYFFGPVIAMLGFTFLVCMVLKRYTLTSMVLFSIIWVGSIYFVFVVLLKIPFDRGIIFDMLR
jgi:hypothetical protein